MTARRAISVNDDNGIYQIALGARPAPWSDIRAEIEYDLGYDDPSDLEITTELLMGWDRWTWAILIDGKAVCFVDGADEPTDLPCAAEVAR